MLRKGSNQRKTSRHARAGGRKDSSRGASSGQSNGRSSSRSEFPPAPFVLYVEGARDREILACWARKIERDLARGVEDSAVILGGRQPARAIADFRKRGGADAGLTGLVVLDRDDHTGAAPHSAEPVEPSTSRPNGPFTPSEESGLGVFVWGRRHIESYLLVPEVLRRVAGLDPDDRRIERFVAATTDGAARLHAKRVLGPGGSLTEVIGQELRAGDIARAMRLEDFHPDILVLFDHITRALGLARSGPEVVVRARIDR